MVRMFFVFGERDDPPETSVVGDVGIPRVGEVVRFYVKAWHGRADVEDAADHMRVDGVPYRVAAVRRAYCRNHNGEWLENVTVRLADLIGGSD